MAVGARTRGARVKHHELLLELGCEEIPASWLPGLTRQLAERVTAQLAAARLECARPVETFSTPRRLVACAPAVAERQDDLEATVTGPPVDAAYDAEGQPTPAAHGFARKHGAAVGDLVRVETAKGTYLAYHRHERGLLARAVLPSVLSATLRDLVFPKRMQWDARLDDGRGEFLFGRPIRWIVFLFGGRVVPFVIERTPGATAAGVAPVRATQVSYGHRFFAQSGKPGRPLRVKSFTDYRKRLAEGCVVIDRSDRQARITRKLEACARRVGGRVAALRQGSSLLDEVPDLVECPAVVTGTFPAEFLELPDEVLSTTMIHHQHYFPVADRRGRLKPHFLAVTNTPRDNVARIARNAERVLVARLRDARFFWDADRKVPLGDRLERLDTLRFHRALGSYRDKTERVAELAARIARDVFDASDADTEQARRAGMLSKADLATDMVGEFPELQGVMGGVYAREQGEREAVWKAIYFHYLPIGIEATAPPSKRDLGAAAATWASVSLADKLDTVVGLFRAGEKPTGSRDPLGMRRQAQGLLRILVDLPELTGVATRVSVGDLLRLVDGVHDKPDTPEIQLRETTFILERLRFVLEARGYDVRNVRSVTHQRSLDDVRPLDARRKLEVLPTFTGSADFRQLATLFKRVKNIATEVVVGDADASDMHDALGRTHEPLLQEPSERGLLRELDRRRSVIDGAVASGSSYRAAFAEAAKLGPTVDRFFDDVLVMADDPALRAARLWLVKRVERVILQLADVSEIVRED